MSEFSGKCDFADHISICGLDSTLKSDIYIGSKSHKLNVHGYKDLIPYLAHIIGISAYDNVIGNGVIILSSKSYVDEQEEDSLNFKLKHVLRYYNKCKRKKIEFNKEECLEKMVGGYHWYSNERDIYSELIDRVVEKGKKATIDGLHLSMADYYRKQLVKEMLKYDINPNEYDLGRFVDSDGNIIKSNFD